MKRAHLLLVVIVLALVSTLVISCKGKEEYAEPEAFRFVVYPGARYLGQLTDVTKKAHTIVRPGEEAPPTAIYDTDAPLETVAAFYAKEYGYEIVPQKPAEGVKAQAWYYSGDMSESKQLADLAGKLGIPTDFSRAQGPYRAAYFEPKNTRPRVTLQRPYFDGLSSQVVDRTIISMTR